MISLAFEELRALELGRLEGGGELTGVQIDSRRVRPGDLFVAVGRGAEFVAAARDVGAAATLVPDDAFAALAHIAALVRSHSDAHVVCITGSTGKTSTKDILAALCAPVTRTVAAEASFNNELGVPLTLCRLEHDTEVLIVELGMRGFGQIAELCRYVRPTAGVITAIGPAHLEQVGSVAGVARAKGELLEALPPKAPAVVPADVPELEPFLRADLDVRRVPALDEADVAVGERESSLGLGDRAIRFPFTARHQLQNALTALIAYEALGLPLDRVQEGASNARLSPWRSEEVPLPGGGLVVNDAYNANPTSMRAALLDVRERAGSGRAVAVLGGMAELGDDSAVYHRRTAELARELDIEVLAVGELAREYDADRWVGDVESALAALTELVRPGDVVLVKASRAVGLEGIASALTNPHAAWSAS